jgi:hypothetical protein
MSALYLHCRGGAAIAMRRQGIKLAGATPIAIAGGDFDALDTPVDMGHQRILR